MKVEFDTIKKRMLAFWAGESIGQACVAVTAPYQPGDNISMFHNDVRDMDKNPQALLRYWEDPVTIRQNSLNRINRTWFGGEALPVVYQNYGTSGHCRYYGAKPTYGNDTIWFDPVWEAIPDSFTFDETELLRQLVLTKYFCENAGGDYLVGMPDNCGTMDAISHLRGAVGLMHDLIEEPEKVLKALEAIDAGWVDSSERFYQSAYAVNKGGVHAWMHLWAPDRIVQMQCDYSVMISPKMFEKFALPELLRQSESADYVVYHFDGIAQERHLDYILSLPNLKAIQWTEVAGEPSPANFIPVLKRMQDAGKSLVIMCPPNDILPLLNSLSSRGLYLHTTAKTPEEGERIVAMVEKHSRD